MPGLVSGRFRSITGALAAFVSGRLQRRCRQLLPSGQRAFPQSAIGGGPTPIRFALMRLRRGAPATGWLACVRVRCGRPCGAVSSPASPLVSGRWSRLTLVEQRGLGEVGREPDRLL